MSKEEAFVKAIKWFEANVQRYPSKENFKRFCVNNEKAQIEFRTEFGTKIITYEERKDLDLPIHERTYYEVLKRLRERGELLVFTWTDGGERIHLLTVEERGMLHYFDESIKVIEEVLEKGHGDIKEGVKRFRCPVCGLEAEWNERTKEFAWLLRSVKVGPVKVMKEGSAPSFSFSIAGVSVPAHDDCELYKLFTKGEADFKKLKEVKFVITSERYKDALHYVHEVAYSRPDDFKYVILLARLDKILQLMKRMVQTENPIYVSEAVYILKHILLKLWGTQRYLFVVENVKMWLEKVFDNLIQLWDDCIQNYSLHDLSPSFLISNVLKCTMLALDSGVDKVCDFIIKHIERFDPDVGILARDSDIKRYFDWYERNPFKKEEYPSEILTKLWRKRAELLNHPNTKVRKIADIYIPSPYSYPW